MKAETHNPPVALPEAAWQELDELFDELSELARSGLPRERFYHELLSSCVSGLSAFGGAVWIPKKGRWRIQHQVDAAADGALEMAAPDRGHAQLLGEVAEIGEGRAMLPGQSRGDASNPTKYLLVVAPVRSEGEDQPSKSVALIELFLHPAASAAARQGYQRFLNEVCELAAEYHARRELKSLRERKRLWDSFARFTKRVHGKRGLLPAAYALANEGRAFIGCDRVSVVTCRGRRCRLKAVSGVEKVQRRATASRKLERLARLATRYGPLWYSDHAHEVPPEVEAEIQEYLDQSDARLIAALPMYEQTDDEQSATYKLLGVLIVEDFDTKPAIGTRGRAQAVADHGGIALATATQLSRLPFAFLWRALPLTSIALMLVAAAACALTFVQTDFHVRGTAELQPVVRPNIFATADGEVSEVRIQHGAEVAAGETLIVLKNPQLELALLAIQGEIDTTRKKLEAIEAARVQLDQTRGDEVERLRLSGEEKETREKLVGLDRQLSVLEQLEEKLTITSPIAGRVLTWDVQQRLLGRPVRRGQVLLTVAEVSGDWELLVSVPDDRVGYLLDARVEIESELPVTYVLASEPEETYHGDVARVATTTEQEEKNAPPVAIIEVDLTGAKPKDVRPGATAKAKIYCGERSLGYVWFHDAIEATRQWLTW